MSPKLNAHLRRTIRSWLWRLGFDVSRVSIRSHSVSRQKAFFDSFDIDVVLDVGANEGQFAKRLRSVFGYTNRIVSFEPLSTAYEALLRNSQFDAKWDAHNIALGDVGERREINISDNSVSSSFLKMLPEHQKAVPDSRYIGRQSIAVKSLDSIFSEFCNPIDDNIYMKIDTQGFESKVIEGASKSLKHIDAVQMEMSLAPLYENEVLFAEMCELMHRVDFNLMAIEPAFVDPVSKRILQVDGYFGRSHGGVRS